MPNGSGEASSGLIRYSRRVGKNGGRDDEPKPRIVIPKPGAIPREAGPALPPPRLGPKRGPQTAPDRQAKIAPQLDGGTNPKPETKLAMRPAPPARALATADESEEPEDPS